MEGGYDAGAASLSPQLAYEPVAQEAYAPPMSGPMGPLAREFHAARATAPSAPAPARSMAETLQGMLGATSAGASANVRDAYAKLARFGL
jgi:hypothetical protein